MFKLFRKIIDEKTLRHYCFSLTGVSPLSKIEAVGQPKKFCDGNFVGGLVSDRDPYYQIAINLEFDYDGKKEDSEPLIVMYFCEYIKSGMKLISINSSNITNGSTYIFALCDFSFDASIGKTKMRREDVEMAAEVAKWIIAIGMGNGQAMANDIVSRKNFNPRTEF